MILYGKYTEFSCGSFWDFFLLYIFKKYIIFIYLHIFKKKWKTECLITLTKTYQFAMIPYGKYTEFSCGSFWDFLFLYIFKKYVILICFYTFWIYVDIFVVDLMHFYTFWICFWNISIFTYFPKQSFSCGGVLTWFV